MGTREEYWAEGYRAGRDGEFEHGTSPARDEVERMQVEFDVLTHELQTVKAERDDAFRTVDVLFSERSDAIRDYYRTRDELEAARDALALSGEALREARVQLAEADGNNRAQEAAAWDDGMQFGAKTEQDRMRKLTQQFVLAVLGKDRGDGIIELGALGRVFVD
jgi:hypothetical protein